MSQATPEFIARRAAEIYARGADRLDKSLWRQVMADDCLIEGPGFHNQGIDACVGLIDTLSTIFLRTRHNVMNVTADFEGDLIKAETYCIADHIQVIEGEKKILSWHIRYQDVLAQEGGEWRYTHRNLLIDWEEIRSLSRDEVSSP